MFLGFSYQRKWKMGETTRINGSQHLDGICIPLYEGQCSLSAYPWVSCHVVRLSCCVFVTWPLGKGTWEEGIDTRVDRRRGRVTYRGVWLEITLLWIEILFTLALGEVVYRSFTSCTSPHVHHGNDQSESTPNSQHLGCLYFIFLDTDVGGWIGPKQTNLGGG